MAGTYDTHVCTLRDTHKHIQNAMENYVEIIGERNNRGMLKPMVVRITISMCKTTDDTERAVRQHKVNSLCGIRSVGEC